MSRSRFNDTQILAILKEHNAGLKVAELCRTHGICEATFYNWKAKYITAEKFDPRQIKVLEDENVKLKNLLADAMLDNVLLKDQLGKKWG